MGTPLNVAILMSRVRVEEKLLLTELEKRGVSIQRIDDRQIMLDLDRPNLDCDVVLERAVNHLRALYALRIYNDWGIPTVNTYDVANTCGDKLLTTAALMRHQCPLPAHDHRLHPGIGAGRDRGRWATRWCSSRRLARGAACWPRSTTGTPPRRCWSTRSRSAHSTTARSTFRNM